MRKAGNNKKKKPKAIDLFCGAGGVTEGLRLAGFNVIGAVENDPLAYETFRMNHPSVHLWCKGVENVACAAVLRTLGLRPGELDLLAACPPCQGFSSMRTRNGAKKIRDGRNDLVFEMLRFVRVLRPKALMLENVPGFASDHRFQEFRREIAKLGYNINWDILNVAKYGVPQRRRRLILMAAKNGEPQFAPEARKSRSVRDAIGDLTDPVFSRDKLHNYGVVRSDEVIARINAIPKDGGSRSALGATNQLQCHRRVDGFRDVYGRMAWNAVSPTITGGCINPSKGRFLHPEQDRAITLREAALLQSFPKSYRFSLARGRYAAAQLIGNALPPEFIRRHALALRISTLP